MLKPENELMSAIFCTRYGEYPERIFFEDEELEESIDGLSLREALNSALDSASLFGGPSQRSRVKRVLELRFGFVDDHRHTFKEIGSEFHLTRERIRQIQQRGLRILRHPSRSRALRLYIKSSNLHNEQ